MLLHLIHSEVKFPFGGFFNDQTEPKVKVNKFIRYTYIHACVKVAKALGTYYYYKPSGKVSRDFGVWKR